jgi:hypothetical protein
LDIDRIIADDFYIRAQLAQIMDQIVGKTVIVIDQKQHILAFGF